MITRQKAQELLQQHVKDPYQKLHVMMVANALEEYAKKYDEDVEIWYLTGLLHDLDYYEYPYEHPKKSLEWFKKWNLPQKLIQAVAAHAWDRTGTKPQHKLDYALIACDELSGLLYAYSLMRPTGFQGMEAKSVMKKFKDKAFAAKIDREEIKLGVDGLGIDMKEHIETLINVYNKMPELAK